MSSAYPRFKSLPVPLVMYLYIYCKYLLIYLLILEDDMYMYRKCTKSRNCKWFQYRVYNSKPHFLFNVCFSYNYKLIHSRKIHKKAFVVKKTMYVIRMYHLDNIHSQFQYLEQITLSVRSLNIKLGFNYGVVLTTATGNYYV